MAVRQGRVVIQIAAVEAVAPGVQGHRVRRDRRLVGRWDRGSWALALDRGDLRVDMGAIVGRGWFRGMGMDMDMDMVGLGSE